MTTVGLVGIAAYRSWTDGLAVRCYLRVRYSQPRPWKGFSGTKRGVEKYPLVCDKLLRE